MSHLGSIDNLIYEYDNLLIRDLGFSDWKSWEPMIIKIMEVLGVNSLKGASLRVATKEPGEKIIMHLINSWLLERKGKYWKDLVGIKRSTYSTPYYDRTEYILTIKSKEEFLKGLSGLEVYQNYQAIFELFDSPDYKTLLKLNGIKISKES